MTRPLFAAYVDDCSWDGWLIAGTEIVDFRGEPARFQYVSAAPIPGKSAKIVVRDEDGHDREFYAQVFNVVVHEWIDGGSTPRALAAPLGVRVEPKGRRSSTA